MTGLKAKLYQRQQQSEKIKTSKCMKGETPSKRILKTPQKTVVSSAGQRERNPKQKLLQIK